MSTPHAIPRIGCTHIHTMSAGLVDGRANMNTSTHVGTHTHARTHIHTERERRTHVHTHAHTQTYPPVLSSLDGEGVNVRMLDTSRLRAHRRSTPPVHTHPNAHTFTLTLTLTSVFTLTLNLTLTPTFAAPLARLLLRDRLLLLCSHLCSHLLLQ